MTESWYDKSLEQIEHRFEADRGRGLDREKVVKSRKKFGPNNIYPTKITKFFEYRKKMSTDYASLILLVAAAIAAIFDVPVAAGAIALMVVVNHVAAIFTFVKAQRVLEGMEAYSLPTAKVLRDGKLALLDMRALVPGDVIFLSAGDIVPADCRIFAADGLYINEGTLTGNLSSVRKDPNFAVFRPGLRPSEQLNMAFATTIVTAGNGRAMVVATGDSTVAVENGNLKPIVTHENLRILSKLRGYCKTWSLAMLLMIFIVVIAELFANTTGAFVDKSIFDVVMTGLSLAAASMAELFTAFGYIVIGCGIFNAMKRRKDVNVGALIKNAEKLEELRELDCLIIPKDGMITQSHSRVEKIYIPRRLFTASDRDRLDHFRGTVLSGVISTGIYGAGLSNLNSSSRKITADEEALIELASDLGLYNSNIDRNYPIIEHMAAGGASKFETTLTLDTDRRYMAVCRGDVEEILNSCEYYSERTAIYRMTTEDRLEFLGAAQSLMRENYKVVALATGVTGYNNLQRIGSIQSDLTLEGFIAIREPLQPGIAQTIARARAAGIRVIMSTDRYTESDKYIAMSVGIIKDESEILTEGRMLSMNRDLLRVNLPLYNMFCGIPAQSLAEIVGMLRADGKKVGLLAGGINGALLLKRADVGFAQAVTISPKASRSGIDIKSRQTPAYSRIVGAHGKTFDSEALKFISDVVVSDADERGDGGFAAVISALEYSRSIYKGLLRVVRYLVTTQFARIFLILGSMFVGMDALSPVQLCYGGLIIDFAAVVCAAFSKPPHDALSIHDDAEKALDKFLTVNIRPILFALFEAVSMLLLPLIVNSIGYTLKATEFMSICFISFTLCQLIDLTEYASDRSIFSANLRLNIISALFILVLLGTIAAALLFPAFGKILGVTRLGLVPSICCGIVPLLTLGLHELYKLLTKKK